MIRTPTLKTVPFKIMRPALHTLMGSALMVFPHVADTIDQKLATKIFLLRDASNKLENPTRHNMATHLAAWYGVTLELAEAIATTQPELSALLLSVCKEADWIEPAWVYMRERMQEWQKL